MCYPNSVLFHVRVRNLTTDQVHTLRTAHGLNCSVKDDDTCVVRARFAHSIPSWPNLDELEQQLRSTLKTIVPDAVITDVRSGYRYNSDGGSPGADALHNLQSQLAMLMPSENIPDDLSSTLASVQREWSVLYEWLCNGGSLPAEWARRHPGGDQQVTQQIEELHASESTLAFTGGT